MRQVLFQFLVVERIQREQFLDLFDQCHRIGLDLIAVTLPLTARVFDLSQKRRIFLQPAHDAKALDALHQKLALLLGARRHAMQPNDAADFGDIAYGDLFALFVVDVSQAQQIVPGLGDGLQGTAPTLQIDNNGLHQARKVRARIDGHDVQGIRKYIVGHRKIVTRCLFIEHLAVDDMVVRVEFVNHGESCRIRLRQADMGARSQISIPGVDSPEAPTPRPGVSASHPASGKARCCPLPRRHR